VLELALAAKSFGQRPSILYGITDPAIALDFDLTCNRRLMLWDIYLNKKEAESYERAKHEHVN
jgi:hypothetical protein